MCLGGKQNLIMALTEEQFELDEDEDTGKLVQSILNQFGFNEEVMKAAEQLGILLLFSWHYYFIIIIFIFVCALAEKKLRSYNIKEANLMEFLTMVEKQAKDVEKQCVEETVGKKRKVPENAEADEPYSKRMKAGPSEVDIKQDVSTDSDFKPLVIIKGYEDALMEDQVQDLKLDASVLDVKKIYVVKPELAPADAVLSGNETDMEPTSVSTEPRLATVISQGINQIREPTAVVTEAEQTGKSQEPAATAATGVADQTILITQEPNKKAAAPPTEQEATKKPKSVARKSFPKAPSLVENNRHPLPDTVDSLSSVADPPPVPEVRELQLDDTVRVMESDELKPWVEATLIGVRFYLNIYLFFLSNYPSVYYRLNHLPLQTTLNILSDMQTARRVWR